MEQAPQNNGTFSIAKKNDLSMIDIHNKKIERIKVLSALTLKLTKSIQDFAGYKKKNTGGEYEGISIQSLGYLTVSDIYRIYSSALVQEFTV